MSDTSISGNVSLELLEVVERARREPEGRFHSLAHRIDVSALERAYQRTRKSAAVGVDGVTKEQYGQNLEVNLQDLHARMKAKQYRHQPIRRINIPKEGGKTRPIGISAFEDKLVQGALREVLEAIYEQDFVDCSHGFRPGRNAHDAVRTLTRVVDQGRVNWILEADIMSFFDSLNRKQLKEMLEVRVADGSLLRLIGKCLHVGVLDGEEFSTSETGTAQGSVLSPLLGNIYLHYVLDLWFERRVKPQLHGQATLIRYADDFVICFEDKGDAERVMDALGKRLEHFGLTLHPDKTHLLPFRRPPMRQQGGKGQATFARSLRLRCACDCVGRDFLGFTFYWTRTRRGRWAMRCKTRSARLRRFIVSVSDWCRRHRHLSVAAQHRALTRRIQGHFNYFGVSGNLRVLQLVITAVRRVWFKWLCRRSQRKRLTWERFADLLRDFPLPKPRIVVPLWGP